MSAPPTILVLGSRSPQRLELLRLLVDPARIVVRPPVDSDEPGFEGLTGWPKIEARLIDIVRLKSADVVARTDEPGVVLTADTVIVGEAEYGSLVVLGQPPERDDWPNVVRGWFREFFLGRTHTAATAVRVVGPRGDVQERVVTTRVSFADADPGTVDWYIGTGEPRGRAGGYAMQGAGSLFVERLEGSPSNVVGLPLAETRAMLAMACPELLKGGAG